MRNLIDNHAKPQDRELPCFEQKETHFLNKARVFNGVFEQWYFYPPDARYIHSFRNAQETPNYPEVIVYSFDFSSTLVVKYLKGV